MNVEAIDVNRVRTEFLKQAVLWVCELAARDRLEAGNLAGELRRYFESVVDNLPPHERHALSVQIDDICEKLAEYEVVPVPVRRT